MRIRWLERMEGAPPAVRAKATVFVKVNVVVVAMLAFNAVVVEWLLTHNHQSAEIEALWIAVIVGAFVLLRRGHYRLASNLTIIAGLASLAALGFADSVGGPMLSFTRLAFLLTPAIVYAFLLGDGAAPPVWATAASLAVLAVYFFLGNVGYKKGDLAWFFSTYLVIIAIGYMARRASTIYLDAIAGAERAGARLRTIFDAINDGVVILDPASGVILDANHKTVELYGWTRAELLGKDICELSSNVAPYTQSDAAAWMALARAGESPTFEWQARSKDGKVFWVEVSMRQDEIDGADRLLVSIRDIEVRKQAESDRAHLEARLRQAEKMDAIGHLAGGVAHDFNNQLTGIMGYAELLASSVEDPELATFAAHIARAARRSADLTRQLLAFARRGNYQAVAVDVHALLGEVVTLLERSLDKRISIRLDLVAASPVVLGDPSQLQNALLNLAINARDAMPDGGELRLGTSMLGSFVRVVVADTGSGMSEETLNHVFEPFFTTKEPGKGTGMGLASVYGAVEIHKGKITVESALGKGTTFQIDLPLSQQPGAGPQSPRAEAVSLSGRRVLVIDDEAEVRDVIREVLSRAGCAVETCSGGATGLAAFTARWRQIDVVILDIVMPEMSGRAVFSALRQIDPDVRVLILSGHSLDGETRALLDDGAQALLDKPFHAEALVAKVDACAAPG